MSRGAACQVSFTPDWLWNCSFERLRSLSQALHPSILDDYGLEKALEWYVAQFGKQTGIAIRYEKQGSGPAIGSQEAIQRQQQR